VTTTHEEAAEIVNTALAHGVTGDTPGGIDLLIPLISESIGSCYALACMLAETASFLTRRDQPAGQFVISVDNVETGETGSIDVFPPEQAFAAQFTTAWANRDHDAAEALFRALVHSAGSEGPQLVWGLLALYELAVVTATEIVREQRAARGEEPTP
jgi:hypothetical protein